MNGFGIGKRRRRKTDGEKLTKAQAALEEKRALYKFVFETEQGRKVLDDIAHLGGLGANLFDPQSERVTNYNLGRRSLARDVYMLVNG